MPPLSRSLWPQQQASASNQRPGAERLQVQPQDPLPAPAGHSSVWVHPQRGETPSSLLEKDGMSSALTGRFNKPEEAWKSREDNWLRLGIRIPCSSIWLVQSIVSRGQRFNMLITHHVWLIPPHQCHTCAVLLADVQADAVRETDQMGELQERGIRENDRAGWSFLRSQTSHQSGEKRWVTRLTWLKWTGSVVRVLERKCWNDFELEAVEIGKKNNSYRTHMLD